MWITDENNGFSVKGCAKEISKHDRGSGLHSLQLRKISFVWKLKVPSKVGIFGWRYVFGRLPTRELLKARRIIIEELDPCCFFLFSKYGELFSSF